MQLDETYLIQLLEKLVESEKAVHQMPADASPRKTHHLDILLDRGHVTTTLNGYFRITSNGHEFLRRHYATREREVDMCGPTSEWFQRDVTY